MHELSLARDLLAAIERKLDRSNARVVRVSLSVGRRPESCQNRHASHSVLSVKERG